MFDNQGFRKSINLTHRILNIVSNIYKKTDDKGFQKVLAKIKLPPVGIENTPLQSLTKNMVLGITCQTETFRSL